MITDWSSSSLETSLDISLGVDDVWVAERPHVLALLSAYIAVSVHVGVCVCIYLVPEISTSSLIIKNGSGSKERQIVTAT